METNSLKAQELNAQVQYRLIEELSASEQRYRELIERIREVVFRCDRGGGLVFLNPAWTALLGYDVSTSLGRQLVDFVVEEDHERALGFTAGEAGYGGAGDGIELRFRRADGSEIWLLLAVQGDGKGGRVGSLYDIDDRKRAQHSLEKLNENLECRVQQRTAELAESNRQLESEMLARKEVQENLLRAERLAVVGETSGRVAHEVLNPITSVYSRIEHMGAKLTDLGTLVTAVREVVMDWREEYRNGTFVEYLASVNDEGVAYGDEDFSLIETLLDKQAEFQAARDDDVRFITRQLDRVIRIINNLRGAVRQSRSVQRIAIVDPIEEAYEVMEDSLAKRRIRIVKELAPDLPDVMVDENELIQVFTNLFRNAMQSIDEKEEGSGFIATRTSLAEDGVIEIRISDSGTGIAESHQDAIFNFDFSTKDREQGTGMGLGISRRFVRENGGDMVLEKSEVGVGTTFLIRLPVAQ